MKDDFIDFIGEIAKLHILTGSAIDLLPEDLSEKTKKRLMENTPEEAAKILAEAIRTIERGSIASIDSLVWETLHNREKKNTDFYFFISEIEKLHILPRSVIDLLFEDLSDRTKDSLLKMTPEKATSIIQEAIQEIENGSLDRMDLIMWNKIKDHRKEA